MKKVVVIILMILMAFSVLRADEFKERARMLIRVLNYDRSIGTRTHQGVRVSVVYDNTNAQSVQEAVAMAGALAALSGERVNNSPVTHTIDLVADDLQEKIKGYAAVYVCTGANIANVTRATSRAKVLSIGSDNAYRGKVGVLLASDGGSIRVHIKDSQVKSEGAVLAAELMSIAVIE